MSHKELFSEILKGGHGDEGSAELLGKERLWSRGEFIIRSGEPLEELHLFIEGRARVLRPLYNGKQFLHRIYHAGSIIGDIEFFTGAEAICSVQCLTESRTRSLDMERLRSERRRYARLIFLLGRTLAQKLEQNSISEASRSGYELEARVAAYYLTHPDPQLQAGSLKELSDWLGSSYRHLIRIHSRFLEEGALRREGGRYRTGDARLLEDYAGDALFDAAGIND